MLQGAGSRLHCHKTVADPDLSCYEQHLYCPTMTPLWTWVYCLILTQTNYEVYGVYMYQHRRYQPSIWRIEAHSLTWYQNNIWNIRYLASIDSSFFVCSVRPVLCLTCRPADDKLLHFHSLNLAVMVPCRHITYWTQQHKAGITFEVWSWKPMPMSSKSSQGKYKVKELLQRFFILPHDTSQTHAYVHLHIKDLRFF